MTGPAREGWQADFDRVAEALLPYVIHIDGRKYLGDGAPPALARLHGQLTSIGYANGWL